MISLKKAIKEEQILKELETIMISLKKTIKEGQLFRN
jgi:hypothetical protein